MEFRRAARSALVVGAAYGLLSASGCHTTAQPGAARQGHTAAGGGLTFDPPPATSQGITLVARQSFGDRGNFGDVWVHGGYAYVGSFRAQHCPGHGVSVADVRDPSRPVAVSTFAAHPGTAAEDIEVAAVDNRNFTGTLAVVALQDCSEDRRVSGARGIELWNVTDPRRPERLGGFDTGAVPRGGVHELDLFQRNGRHYVIAATDYYAFETDSGESSVRILDVTDPRAPVQVSEWRAGRDGHLAYGSPFYARRPPGNCAAPEGATSDCRVASSGGYPVVSAHSASVNRNGTRAYVSYWDAGMILLDLEDLARPTMIGRGNSGADEEGDLHSAIEVNRNVAITTDEDFSPIYNLEREHENDHGDVWGFARVWDISDPARPVQIATIESPHSASHRTDGIYAAHNPVTVGDLAFFSWYTDGVRVYDIANPSRPRLAAFFDAPRVPDPRPVAEFPLPTGSFWGVVVQPPYVYASDMNAGLYVLRLSPDVMNRLP